MNLRGIIDKKYKLELYTLSEKPIGEITTHTGLVYSPAIFEMSQLNFRIDKYINDETGQPIPNIIYPEIKGDMYIVVDEKEWFFVKSAKEVSDKGVTYKEVLALSREYELIYKDIAKYTAEGRFLYYIEPDGNKGFPYNESTYPSNAPIFPTIDSDGLYTGIFNQIEKMTAWRLERDSVTGYPIIPEIIAKRSRGLDFSSSNLFDVINKLQEIFGCVFIFDTENRIIEIKEPEGLTVHSGILLSDRNFITKLEKDIVTENIITRVKIQDKDGKTIAPKMPHGQSYIENYTWFMNEGDMPTHLINALNGYMYANNQYHVDISEWWTDYDKAMAERDETELIIAKKKSDLLPYSTTIDVLTTKEKGTTLTDGTTIPPSPLSSEERQRLNEANTKAKKLKAEIKELEEGYKPTTPRSLPLINDDIDKALDNIKNYANKFTMEQMFSEYETTHGLDKGYLMLKMEPFIREKTIVLDYSATVEEIYQAGVRIVNELSQPPIQFSLDVEDFLQLTDYKDLWDIPKLGMAMDVGHSELDFSNQVVLLGYEHNVENRDLKMKFSNKRDFITDNKDIAKLLASTVGTGSKVSIGSPDWNRGGTGTYEKIGYIHDNIKAISAEIIKIYAEKIDVEQLNAVVANIESLIALKANIDDLTAINASIQDLYAGKANISELEAISAIITILEADYADITTLLAGNLTAENFMANAITATSGIIANGAILNAMIANLDVSKLNAGAISTNKIGLVSDSGNFNIYDNTLQISDGNYVRVQVGKDQTGDYTMVVWDEDGDLMWDARGITEDGIKGEIIRNDMVSPTANIDGSKLNIESVVQEINEGTTRIESSHINYDGESLNIAFGEMTGVIDGLNESLSTLITDFTIEQGKISSLISDVEIIEGEVDSTKSRLTSAEQSIDGFSQTVSNLEEDHEGTKSQLSSLEQNVEGFQQTVTSTYATKQYVTNEAPVYTWIMYADTENGVGISPIPTDKQYIGIAHNKQNITPSNDPSDYKWSRVKGDDGQDGEPGLPGEPGEDGETTYTWVKYADTPTSGMDDYPEGKKYIGLAFNKTTQTESTDYSDYEWSLMPQNMTVGGRNLVLNSNLFDGFIDEVPTESEGDFEVIGDEWGRNLLRGVISTGFTLQGAREIYPDLQLGEIYIISFNYEILEGEPSSFLLYGTDGSHRETLWENIPVSTKPIGSIEYSFTPTLQSHIPTLRIYTGRDSAESRGVKVEFLNLKLEKGSQATPWTPAPEDLNELKGTQYNLSTTLKKDQYYTLSVEGTFVEDDFVGVWLGSDKFIGYLQDNKITFKANEDYEDKTIILKSLSEEGNIDWVKLEKGDTPTDWTPAPEDVQAEIDENKIIKSDEEPEDSTKGQIWLNTSTSPHEFFIYHDGDWIYIGTNLEYVYESIGNISDDLANFIENYDEDSISIDERININSSDITQLSDEISTKVSQTQYDENYDEINQSMTEHIQDFESFKNTIQIGGGDNLIKNSVGYGGLNYWEVIDGEIESTNNSTWILEGISKYGWRISNGEMYQIIDLSPNKDCTLSGKYIKSTPAGNLKIELYDIEFEELIETIVDESDEFDGEFIHNFNVGDIRQVALYIKIEEASTVDPIMITDLMLAQGENYNYWSQAMGETYTLNVRMDGEGVTVYNADGQGKTVMSPEEFAGYYNNRKIFTLNGDITEVMGLLIKEKGLFIPPIKMVQNRNEPSLDVVWTGVI